MVVESDLTDRDDVRMRDGPLDPALERGVQALCVVGMDSIRRDNRPLEIVGNADSSIEIVGTGGRHQYPEDIPSGCPIQDISQF